MPATLSVPTTESAESESRIDSLLGADLGVGTVETAEPAEGDTPLAGEEPTVEDEGGEPTEATQDDPEAGDEPAEGEVAEGESEGEEEFDLSGLETDYAESAYAKAAEHFGRVMGEQFDPKNSKDRKILKELMDRGRALSEQRATQTEEDDPEEEAEAQPVTAAMPAKTPQEVMQARLAGAKAYAKESVVPEIAMDFAQSFVDSIWPGKNVKVTQEQAMALTQTMTTFGALLVGDAMPSILGAVPQAVRSGVPMFDKVITMAEREAVVDEVMGAVDKQGNPQFPGIDRLIENGTIKRIVSTDLKEAVFSKDPYKNLVAKTKMAYKMARGEGFDPKLITTAVNRGKEMVRERARKVASGRVPAGSSRSATAGRERSGAAFVDSLAKAGQGGGRFHTMLQNLGK